MKRSGLLFLLAAVLLIPAAFPADDAEFELSGAVLSHYLWRGIRLSEGGVFQPSVTVAKGGFSANLWANYQFDPHGWTELDFSAAYSIERRKFIYEVGYVHYAVRDDLDSDEFYGSLGHSNALNPSLKLFIDVNEGKGAYLQAGIEPELPLAKKLSMNFKAFAGYVFHNAYMGVNEAGREFSNFYNADFQVSLTLPLGRRFSLEPALGYSTAISRNARQAAKSCSVGSAADTFYGGATLTFSPK